MPSAHERIRIRGGRVYDHDGDVHLPPVADVIIADGLIQAVDPAGEAPPAGHGSFDREIDATGKLLIPGFFNAHYHSHDTLLKGCFETIGLDYWGLYAMPPAYGPRSREELRLRTLVGAVECIRGGITTVADMNFLIPFDPEDADVMLAAYEEAGIRCVFAPQFSNVPRVLARAHYEALIPEDERWRLSAGVPQFPSPDRIVPAIREYIAARRGRSPLVDFALGPASPETCTRELWVALTGLAHELSVPVVTHLYENKGMTHIARTRFAGHQGSLVHWLADCGALGEHLTFAHSVWLRADEIERIADAGARVALNPTGNLKTRSGIAPIRELIDAGVAVGLGCDNCSCSDAQNMFQAMKMYVTLCAVSSTEEGVPAAADALLAATANGAGTAGYDDLGHLRPGMKADLSILDLSDISYVPLNSVARQLVFTEAGRAVETVIVDGRVVMNERRILSVDEDALRREVGAVMPRLKTELDEVRRRLDPVLPHLREAERRTLGTDIGVNRLLIG